MSTATNLTPGPADTAIRLGQSGYWPVGIVAGTKRPRVKDWGRTRPTEAGLWQYFAANPQDGVGLCLGPGCAPGNEWLIDMEGDGPEAEASRAKLFGGQLLTSLGWKSPRGEHHPYVADGPRLLEALRAAGASEGKGASSGVFHLEQFPDLEIRVGGYHANGTRKQIQSVCPPTPGDDGIPREWISGPLAQLPEIAYEVLAGLDNQRAVILPVNSPRPGSDWVLEVEGGGDPVANAALKGEVEKVANAVEGGAQQPDIRIGDEARWILRNWAKIT